MDRENASGVKQVAEELEFGSVSEFDVPRGLKSLRKKAESRSGRWEKPQRLNRLRKKVEIGLVSGVRIAQVLKPGPLLSSLSSARDLFGHL
jgi:hypothetical protein